MKRCIILLALAVTLFWCGVAVARDPVADSSMVLKYRTTLQEFFVDFPREAKVTEAEFLWRMALQGYPVESLTQLQYVLESLGASVRPCEWTRETMPGIERVMRYADSIKQFVVWKRETLEEGVCREGEYIVHVRGRAILSLFCGNVIHLPKPPQKSAPTPRTKKPTYMWIEKK